MQAQLGVLEKSIASFMAGHTPTASIYPHVEQVAEAPMPVTVPMVPVVEPKPLPVAPVAPAAPVAPMPIEEHPEGVIDDVQEVVRRLADVIQKMFAMFSAIGNETRDDSASKSASTSALPSAAVAPTFSRTLPSRQCSIVAATAASPRACAASPEPRTPSCECPCAPATPVAHSEPRVPAISSTEQRARAHARLDEMFAYMDTHAARIESPLELVIASEDELYCINRFRKMVTDTQGALTKNFMQRLDRLCKKS